MTLRAHRWRVLRCCSHLEWLIEGNQLETVYYEPLQLLLALDDEQDHGDSRPRRLRLRRDHALDADNKVTPVADINPVKQKKSLIKGAVPIIGLDDLSNVDPRTVMMDSAYQNEIKADLDARDVEARVVKLSDLAR